MTVRFTVTNQHLALEKGRRLYKVYLRPSLDEGDTWVAGGLELVSEDADICDRYPIGREVGVGIGD
jgi:hypothetical protein